MEPKELVQKQIEDCGLLARPELVARVLDAQLKDIPMTTIMREFNNLKKEEKNKSKPV